MLSSLFILLSMFALNESNASKVETITLEQLQAKTIQKKDNTLYVVNFWATWCRPCIEELPYFEKSGSKFANKNVKVLLVSLDFVSDKEKLYKFVEKKNIQNEVYLLDAGNPNDWIDKIEKKWEGDIPATVFYRKGQKVLFHHGAVSQYQLDSIIQTKIK